MLCPSCGSELGLYPKNLKTGHPCPFCGYVDDSSLPTEVRILIQTHLASAVDVGPASKAAEELAAQMDELGCDSRTKFAARLAFEEALVAKLR